MYVKMKLNSEELAALLALQVSDKNKDSLGRPFFRVTKMSTSGKYRDRTEIQIIEFNDPDDKGREDTLSHDSTADDKHEEYQWPHKGEPIPAELLLLIFNAIGRFPTEAAPSDFEKMSELEKAQRIVEFYGNPRTSGATSHHDLVKLLLKFLNIVHENIHCQYPSDKAYQLLRKYFRAEIFPGEFMNEYAEITNKTLDDAAEVVAVLGRLMALGWTQKPVEVTPSVIPLTSDLIRAIHAIDSLPLEKHPHAFTGWIIEILEDYHAKSPNLRLQLDKAEDLNGALKDNPHFQLIVAYLRKHCLGQED